MAALDETIGASLKEAPDDAAQRVRERPDEMWPKVSVAALGGGALLLRVESVLQGVMSVAAELVDLGPRIRYDIGALDNS